MVGTGSVRHALLADGGAVGSIGADNAVLLLTTPGVREPRYSFDFLSATPGRFLAKAGALGCINLDGPRSLEVGP